MSFSSHNNSSTLAGSLIMTEEVITAKLVVKTLSDRAIVLELADYPTIGLVRAHLRSKECVDDDKQEIKLLCAGSVLPDDTPTSSLPSVVIPSTQIPTTTIHWFHYETLAQTMDPIESAKDWDSKNRLRCFRGLWLLSRRQFGEAAPLLVESLTTFEETSLLPYAQVVYYAVISAILSMERSQLAERVLKNSEVLECIDQLGPLKALLTGLYYCHYAQLFTALAELEPRLAQDWLLAPHAAHVIKEVRIRAYAQMLQSYRSLSLSSMAQAFGVTPAFIEAELVRFIGVGRLGCVIDKVNGLVYTKPPNQRNQEYEEFLQTGDHLFNRLQKIAHSITY